MQQPHLKQNAQGTAWVRSGYSCPIPTNPDDRDGMVRVIELGVHVMVADRLENTGWTDERIAAITTRAVTR